LFVIASANPEDYTSRGRIITPLKDRLGSQIRTHYPKSLEHEIAIMEQEQLQFPSVEGVPQVIVPAFINELLAELTHLARRAPEISQRSGASVRVSVANLEVLRAAALKRAIRLKETSAAPRVSDLGAVIASTAGKIELESVGDESPEERVVERLITKALFTTFNRRLDVDSLEAVVLASEGGFVIETGDSAPLVAFGVAVVLGGIGPVMTRITLHELPPMWGGAFRFTLAAILLAVIVLARGIRPPRGRALAGTILFGSLGMGLSTIL